MLKNHQIQFFEDYWVTFYLKSNGFELMWWLPLIKWLGSTTQQCNSNESVARNSGFRIPEINPRNRLNYWMQVEEFFSRHILSKEKWWRILLKFFSLILDIQNPDFLVLDTSLVYCITKQNFSCVYNTVNSI